MITIYSTGCPKCKIAERLLNSKNIKYELNTNLDEINPIADEKNIDSVPFADINGKIVDSKSLFDWIDNN